MAGLRGRKGAATLRASRILLAAALARTAAAADPPRLIVLVTIDTLRADHVGSYGYSRPTTPFLDSLASRGVVFENAFAASSMTAPCHASLFTGLYPPQHGVRQNDQGFASAGQRRFRTLAEALTAEGYTTAAFSGVGFLRSISQGFLTVDAGSGDFMKYRQADATIDRALAWLATHRPEQRLFLWVHLFDLHPPRRPPTHGAARLPWSSPAEAERFGLFAIEHGGVVPGVYKTPTALADTYAEYDAELLFADHELARLFDRLEAGRFNEHALWVVTADHGEGLGNHAWIDHVRYLYNEAVRVPLIVYANRQWAGTRVRELARHVDVMPTLLAAAGLPFGQRGFTAPGRSLLPLFDGVRLEPALSFSVRRPWGRDHRDWERGEVYALQDLNWKFIAHTAGRDEFFDLRNDPLELKNLADQPSPVKDRLAGITHKMFAGLQQEGSGAVSHVERVITEELRALGYIQ